MSKNISRRKFILTGSGTLLMLALGGCNKKDDGQSVSQVEQDIDPTRETSEVLATPNGIPSENEKEAQDQVLNTPTVAAKETIEESQTEKQPQRLVCPKGMINDPYPGMCKLYVDSNGNGICDYSEANG